MAIRGKKAKTPKARPAPRSDALVHFGTIEPAIALKKEQKLLLAEAIRRGEECRNRVEDAVVEYGRWVLLHIFENDAAAAIEGKRDNAVWHALVERAGGPTMRISRTMLYLCVQIAAHDKRINDEAWRNLEPGRKALLLPLRDEALLRQAAQHVTAMKLTQDATKAYVRSLRSEQGKDVVSKRVQARQIFAGLGRLSAALQKQRPGSAAKLVEGLNDEQRSNIQKQARALLSFASSLLEALR
jgi:hypothetical protein